MKLQLISAVAVCLLSIAACNNASKSPKELSSEEVLELAGKSPGMNAGRGTFTVNTPTGWTKIDTVMSRIEYTFMMAPITGDSTFQANVNIVTQELKKGFTLDKVMESTQKEMESFFVDYKKIDTGERTVTGVKAKWMKCQYVHRESGTLLNGEVTILVKNNIAYAITLTTLANDLVKYEPALEEILGSFTTK
ncbi:MULTISPECIES: LpqN/LpqT family lipoprotein [unclassified Chitinophaga]|uniref:LpqN/LpqT family lipoprotein n=1 Tax=unclassified Chitinophaga TaxID=2619133 RepID=UPI0030100AF9